MLVGFFSIEILLLYWKIIELSGFIFKGKKCKNKIFYGSSINK